MADQTHTLDELKEKLYNDFEAVHSTVKSIVKDCSFYAEAAKLAEAETQIVYAIQALEEGKTPPHNLPLT